MKPFLLKHFSQCRARFFLSCLLLAVAMPVAAYADSMSDFFRAVKNDDSTTLSSMLQHGMSPNMVEQNRGETGIMVALREDSGKVFTVLLDAPAVDLDARARNGDSALMIAAIKGNVGAVKALLAKEVQVNQTGWTALHYAASVGSDEIVKMLLEASAYIDAESTNGTTPLMMAARGGHVSTVKLLLDEGADPTLKNYIGLNALDFARASDMRRVIDDMTDLLKNARKP